MNKQINSSNDLQEFKNSIREIKRSLFDLFNQLDTMTSKLVRDGHTDTIWTNGMLTDMSILSKFFEELDRMEERYGE